MVEVVVGRGQMIFFNIIPSASEGHIQRNGGLGGEWGGGAKRPVGFLPHHPSGRFTPAPYPACF